MTFIANNIFPFFHIKTKPQRVGPSGLFSFTTV